MNARGSTPARPSRVALWLTGGLLATAFALFVIRSNGERRTRERAFEELARTRAAAQRSASVVHERLASIGEAFVRQERELSAVSRRLATLVERMESGGGIVPLPIRSDDDSLPAEADDESEVPVSSLGELPAGIRPVFVLGRDVGDILADERFGLASQEFTRSQIWRLRACLARGQARVAAVDAEEKAVLSEAMDTLKEAGEFVDYPPGADYENVPGVITAAEELPGGGVRMYYVYPERFPGFYSKREEKRALQERAAREFLDAARKEAADA